MPTNPLRADIDNAFAFDGHAIKRSDALAVAKDQLKSKGKTDDEIEDLTWEGNRLVQRAYWAGDALGFCNKEHPLAQPVTVVNLPVEEV